MFPSSLELGTSVVAYLAAFVKPLTTVIARLISKHDLAQQNVAGTVRNTLNFSSSYFFLMCLILLKIKSCVAPSDETYFNF